MLDGACTSKVVKVDVEPVIDLSMDGVILLTDLLQQTYRYRLKTQATRRLKLQSLSLYLSTLFNNLVRVKITVKQNHIK